jgi:hypothetical protein
MRARTAITAALLTLAALTAGCSSSGSSDDKPAAPTATVTKTADQAALRAACVDAWADVIRQNDDAGIDDEPAACDGLPEGDSLDRYLAGLQQVSKANRDEIAECVDDPTCTSVPIP